MQRIKGSISVYMKILSNLKWIISYTWFTNGLCKRVFHATLEYLSHSYSVPLHPFIRSVQLSSSTLSLAILSPFLSYYSSLSIRQLIRANSRFVCNLKNVNYSFVFYLRIECAVYEFLLRIFGNGIYSILFSSLCINGFR